MSEDGTIRTGRSDDFEAAYAGHPPWETGEAQPAVVELADGGQITGPVLDVGCGTGENALYLSGRGLAVLGIDGAPTAIECARAKAAQRGLAARFAVADAFDLAALGELFDTVLDSAFMHIPGNTADRRRNYTDQLAAVLRPGGRVHLLQISDEATGHPSMSPEQILEAFDDRWAGARIHAANYRITTADLPAWLVTLERC